MVRAPGDQLDHRHGAGQARFALSENAGRDAGGIQAGARGAGERGQGRGETVRWAKTPGVRITGHRMVGTPPDAFTGFAHPTIRSSVLTFFWRCDLPRLSSRTIAGARAGNQPSRFFAD